MYNKAIKDPNLREQVEKSWKLNYWDRAKHILLKKKNMYLILILNLMRGSVTKRKFGFFPNSILKYLIEPKRVKYHLQNPRATYLGLHVVRNFDKLREGFAKPVYSMSPLFLRNFVQFVYKKVRLIIYSS